MAVSSVGPYASSALSNSAASSAQPAALGNSGASYAGGSDSYSTGATPDSGTYNAASGDSNSAPTPKKKHLTPGEIAGIVAGTVFGAGGIATVGALGLCKGGWFRKKAEPESTGTNGDDAAGTTTPAKPGENLDNPKDGHEAGSETSPQSADATHTAEPHAASAVNVHEMTVPVR